AIATNRFGGNDVLELTELPDPLVGPDTVLVRTKAVGLNPVDWKSVRGGLQSRFPSHFPLVPCWDVAGVVERVGPAITEFAEGDEVMAYDREDHVQWGTLSELVGVPVRALAHKPAGLGWAEAGALPLAGLTAYQCVLAAGIGPGHTVLIHGASGGVGSFAVQFASWAGARVIGTAGPGNHDYVKSLGAEPVAYGDGLVERVRVLVPEGADVVIDLVGGDALDATLDVGNDRVRLVSVTNPDRVKELGGRYIFVRPDTEQLTELGRLAAEGSLRVHVRATFPFERAADALARVEEGHGPGKVVVLFD
ncbi:MAG: NADP-dependent oxidoreductase, partial [Actinomycetota bacterium]|nr:NADP-dependent oxidoreductase [Actinomycetota bacterium]